MPNLNGMGPRGKGAMTGRGGGRCAGGHPREMGPAHGQGRRRRRRGGEFGAGEGSQAFGEGRRFTDTPERQAEEAPNLSREGRTTAAEQRRALKIERNRLKAMLREVEATLQTLGSPDAPHE